MTVTVRCVALALAVAVHAGSLPGQAAFPMGTHRMVLDSPGGELPFELRLAGDGKGGWLASLRNGDERIDVPEVVDGETLVLRFPHYDSELRLVVDHAASTLAGHWIKQRGGGEETRMTLAARPASKRFPAREVDPPEPPPADWFVGRFRVAFGSSGDPAVGVFARSKAGDAYIDCTATFLTTLGDYRYLAGNVNGGQLRLSCFDGAHAFLFRAERQPDGSLKGDFWSSDTWHEAWTAVRDDAAALPDGWSLTKARDGAEVGSIVARDLFGNERALDDERFRGKVRVLEVFGTWCPNCHDHGAYLAELHRRYAERGLAIVGLAFEHGDDFERAVQQVKRFRERHRADYPVLIAGSSDKAKATESLGLLDRVRAFPTTIFVDREGVVRGVHQGWSGPATGNAEARLKERFEQLIEALLAER